MTRVYAKEKKQPWISWHQESSKFNTLEKRFSIVRKFILYFDELFRQMSIGGRGWDLPWNVCALRHRLLLKFYYIFVTVGNFLGSCTNI